MVVPYPLDEPSEPRERNPANTRVTRPGSGMDTIVPVMVGSRRTWIGRVESVSIEKELTRRTVVRSGTLSKHCLWRKNEKAGTTYISVTVTLPWPCGLCRKPLAGKGAETDQQTTCRVAKDPNNPLIVEWPGTSRTALSAASQKGLVIVSYQDCAMKVLEGCDAGGRYQMKRAAASPERLVIDSEDKLYADLPLGVARLTSYLEQGSRLTLEY
jgi:hypothetical protein